MEARPGRKNENHMAYSIVNHLVMRFWSGLLYDSLACTQPTSGPSRLRATAALRNWRGSGSSSTS